MFSHLFLFIESSRNFTINTYDATGHMENQMFLGHDKLECLTNGFLVTGTNGQLLFSVDRDEVAIGADSLRIDAEGGAVFKESVQTPWVKAKPGKGLK